MTARRWIVLCCLGAGIAPTILMAALVILAAAYDAREQAESTYPARHRSTQ